MSPRQRRLRSAAIICLITLALGEILARGYLKWAAQSSRQYLESTLRFEDGQYLSSLRREVGRQGHKSFHPYFGFTHNLERKGVNRAGFFSPVEYPYRKKPNEFTIGFFGASVADYFVRDEHLEILLRRLKAEIPALRNKDLVLLNMACGAYKQPQSYLIYSYYADMFDLTINLDGFNDVSYSHNRNRFPTDYPNFTGFFHGSIGNLFRVRTAILLADMRFSIAHADWYELSGLTTLGAAAWMQTLGNVSQMVYEKWDERDVNAPKLSPEQFADEMVSIWANSVRKQARLAAAWKTKAYFFIQPNQYVDGSKPFSEEERVHALSNPPSVDLTAQYDKLERERKRLVAEGVRVFSLADAFTHTPETVYKDNCCHVNSLGNRILAERIADQIVKSWNFK